MPKLADINALGGALASTDTFLIVRDNGDGTSTDYRASYSELVSLVLATVRTAITAGSGGYTIGGGGTTLTGAYFSNTISMISTNGQSYIAGTDFTQSGTTITGVTISFFSGQTLVAFQ